VVCAAFVSVIEAADCGIAMMPHTFTPSPSRLAPKSAPFTNKAGPAGGGSPDPTAVRSDAPTDLGTAGPDLMGDGERRILAKKRSNDGEVSQECHDTAAVPANFTLERVTKAVFKVNGARRNSWHNRRRVCSVVPIRDVHIGSPDSKDNPNA
jgi:hypothetical protein